MKVGKLIDFLVDVVEPKLESNDSHAEVKLESYCDYCGKRKVRNLEEHHLIVTDDFRALIIEVE